MNITEIEKIEKLYHSGDKELAFTLAFSQKINLTDFVKKDKRYKSDRFADTFNKYNEEAKIIYDFPSPYESYKATLENIIWYSAFIKHEPYKQLPEIILCVEYDFLKKDGNLEIICKYIDEYDHDIICQVSYDNSHIEKDVHEYIRNYLFNYHDLMITDFFPDYNKKIIRIGRGY